jgi:hypothetical protein
MFYKLVHLRFVDFMTKPLSFFQPFLEIEYIVQYYVYGYLCANIVINLSPRQISLMKACGASFAE